MEKQVRHIHLMTNNNQFRLLKLEAKQLNTNVNELIRRKLSLPPIPSEILLLRQLKIMLKTIVILIVLFVILHIAKFLVEGIWLLWL